LYRHKPCETHETIAGLIRVRIVGLPEEDFRSSRGLDNLDHLAPRLISLFEYHLTLRHAKYLGQKPHQRGVSRPFYWRGGKPDFQRIAMQSHYFGSFRAGLYVQNEGKPSTAVTAPAP
jgi:hypothetical protein